MTHRTFGTAACIATLLAAPPAALAGKPATQRPSIAETLAFRELKAVDALPKPQADAWSGMAKDDRHYMARGGTITSATGEPVVFVRPREGSYDPRVAAGSVGGDPTRIEIRLQQARFDPLRDGVTLPPALAGAARADGDGRDYRIVQFEGPIRAEWRQSLEAHRLEIVEYVPDFAYVVRGDRADTDALDALDGVRWSGAFAQGYRLSADLVPAALAARADRQVALVVRGFAGEPADALRASLQAAGLTIARQGKDTGGGVMFEADGPESALLAATAIQAVAWIELRRPHGLANSVARSAGLTGKDTVEQQYGLFGATQIAAVVDTGFSTGNQANVHADFSGRLLGATYGTGSCGHWGDTVGHGTHVAGSVLGSGARSGSNPTTGQYQNTQAGLAPRAGLVVWSVCEDFSGLPNDIYGSLWSSLYGFHAALRTANNSWGTTGTAGTYTTYARETDRFVRDYPDMTIVFAAGNSGTDADFDGVSDMTTVNAPGTAKNIITVGASENVRSSGGFNPGGACASWGECWPDNFPVPPLAYDPVSNHPDGMAAFSGRGPTASNRLKPDIVAPGTNIVSTLSELADPYGAWGPGDAYYYFQGGTSMASPLVTGAAAVVRDFFKIGYDHDASAALVKATLLNGAWDMSPGQYGTGPQQDVWRRPDINQGWGSLYLPSALFTTGDTALAFHEVYPGLAFNQQWQTQIAVQAGGPELRILIAWTDAPGIEASHGALVNDLDLEVVDPLGGVHYGFAGMLGVERDRWNNVESVAIPSPVAGTYHVRVRGYNVPMGPQPFALAIRGNLAAGDVLFADGFDG